MNVAQSVRLARFLSRANCEELRKIVSLAVGPPASAAPVKLAAAWDVLDVSERFEALSTYRRSLARRLRNMRGHVERARPSPSTQGIKPRTLDSFDDRPPQSSNSAGRLPKNGEKRFAHYQ